MDSLGKLKSNLSDKLSKTKDELSALKLDLKEELASRKEEFLDLKNDIKKSIIKKKNEFFKEPRDNRRDRRNDPRGKRDQRNKFEDRRNFFEKKKEYLIKTFEKIASPVKVKNIVSEKYKNFVKKVDTPSNRKLIALLPYVLLALTVVAVNNKRVIKPMFDAFYTAKEKLKPGSSLVERTLYIITEYLSVFTKGNLFTNIELGMSTLILFLDDIPNIYKKLDTYAGISTFTMQKQLAKNIGELNEELVIKPERERQQRKERQEAKAEQDKFREDMQKLYKIIADKANRSGNINITMPRIQHKTTQQHKQSGIPSSFLAVPGTNPNQHTQKPKHHFKNKVHKRRY